MSSNSENLSELDYQSEPAKVPTNPDGSLSQPSLSTGPDKPHLMLFGTGQKTTAEPTSIQDKGWPFQSTATGYQDNSSSKNNATNDTNEGKDNTPQKVAAGLAGAAAIVAAGTIIITTQYRRENPGTGVSLSGTPTSGGSGTGVSLSSPEPTPYSGGPGTGVSLSGTPTPPTTTAKNSPPTTKPTGGGVANGGYDGGNLPTANTPTGGNNPAASSNSTNNGGGGGYGGTKGGNGYGETATTGTTSSGNPNTATTPASGPGYGFPFGPGSGPGGSLPFGSKGETGSTPGGGGATEIAADIKKISELVDVLKQKQTSLLNALTRFSVTIHWVYNKNINTAIRDHMAYGSQLEGDLGKLTTETLTKWISFLVQGGNEWRKNHSTSAPEILYSPPAVYVVTPISSACYVITDVFPPDMKTAYDDLGREREDIKKAIEEMQTALDGSKDWWKGLMADIIRNVWKGSIFDKKDEIDKKLDEFRMHFGVLMADLVIRDLG